jgi:hypothetical protein
MNKLCLVWVTAFLAMQLPAAAQQTTAPQGEENLQTVLQDENRFGELLTETWVLRDILALHLGGNISAEVSEFQGLQDRLKEQRTTILEKIGTQAMPKSSSPSADRLAATLEDTGVKRDSQLGKRLISAGILFEQAANAGSLGSLCDMHPFRAICAEP